MTAVEPSPDGMRREPVASATPSGLVLIRAVAPFILALEGSGTCSTELSERSVESPSSIRRGIPRTGVKSAGSSSLESAKRLLRLGRASSSSLESARRLEKRELGFESIALGLDLPKPKREGDFVRLESIDDPRRDVRAAGLLESVESRMEVRIPPPPGPTELKGRRAAGPAGKDVRALIDPVTTPESMDEGLIVRFMLYLLLLGVVGRVFLKLLDESLSFRSILGFVAGVFFLF